MNDENVEKRSNKKILMGTILGYISFFLNIFSGIFLTPWIVSHIGNSQYGIYTLCFSVMNIFLFDFGLSLTTNTYLSKLKANNDQKGIEKFTSTIFKIYLAIDLIIAILFTIAYFTLDFIYVGMTLSERSSLKICLLIVGIFSLVSFPSTVFTGSIYSNEGFGFLRIVDIVNKLCLMAFSVIAIKLNFNLYGLVGAYALSGLVSVVLRFICFKFKLHGKLFSREKAEKNYFVDILKFSIWAALLSLASRFVFNIAPSILGITSNSTEIAILGIVITIEGYIYLFGSMMSSLFMPKTYRILIENSDSETIQNISNKVGKIQAVLILLIIFGFLTCGSEFINVWMKDSTYAPAYIGIFIVSLYQIINIPEIVFYDSMMFSNHIKPLAIVSLIKAALNLGLCFLLSYFWGAIGICISICISRLLEQIAYNFLYKKYLKVSIWNLIKTAIIVPLIIGLISFAIPTCIFYFVNISNQLILLFVKGSTFVIIYSVLNFFIVFNRKIPLIKK